MSSHVLVVGEIADNRLHPTVRQTINAAHRIASDASSVTLCLPVDASFDSREIDGIDVAKVLLLEHPDAADDAAGGVYALSTEIVSETVSQLKPAAVLFAKTDCGSVSAARLAARFGTGLASDCIDLAMNPATGRVAVTRPVHGGNALAVYQFSGDGLQVISMRPGALDPAETVGQSPEIEHIDMSGIVLSNLSPNLVETVVEDSEGIPLEQADIVVSGGRGLGGPKPFDDLRELCGLLGAALGASRAACDAGWIDHSYQVGLTGKSISPATYITVAISGASQHMAGCSSARNIVAIDKDREANIFSHARYGVVGDWAKVLPAFTAAVAELD
jgi:electron transfer flavoprotein alpha subunit